MVGVEGIADSISRDSPSADEARSGKTREEIAGSGQRSGATARAGAPIRLVKPGVVKGRLIDDLTGQPARRRRRTCDDRRSRPLRPRSGVAIEGFAVKTDGTFELRLPPGKNSVYVAGGPFLVRKPGDPSAIQDIRQIDVKEGTETTIEFRVIRQVPMKQAPEKPTKNSPASTSGAVTRPAPVMLAEARPSLRKSSIITWNRMPSADCASAVTRSASPASKSASTSSDETRHPPLHRPDHHQRRGPVCLSPGAAFATSQITWGTTKNT